MEDLIPIALIVAFPLMWVGISLALAHTGGWAKLARQYPVTLNCTGPTFYFRSGFVGSVSYKSCLVLMTCETGLRLSVLLPFRLGHPPLFIPWTEFHSVSEKRALFVRFLDTYVGTPVVANVVLPIWVREHIPAGS